MPLESWVGGKLQRWRLGFETLECLSCTAMGSQFAQYVLLRPTRMSQCSAVRHVCAYVYLHMHVHGHSSQTVKGLELTTSTRLSTWSKEPCVYMAGMVTAAHPSLESVLEGARAVAPARRSHTRACVSELPAHTHACASGVYVLRTDSKSVLKVRNMTKEYAQQCLLTGVLRARTATLASWRHSLDTAVEWIRLSMCTHVTFLLKNMEL